MFSQLIKVSNARFQGFLFFLKAAMETCSLMNDIFLWGEVIIEFLDNFGVILLVVVRKREWFKYVLASFPMKNKSVNKSIYLENFVFLVS